MWHNFLDASEARDAVIAGDLAGVGPPLSRLAERTHGADLPADWRPWVEDVQALAKRGAAAKTLPEAAAAVAALGASCGECHRTTKGGPNWGSEGGEYNAEGRTGLAEKMNRHMWSAEELWLGLTGPVHQAWSRGAAGLMNITIPSLVTLKGEPATTDKTPSGEGTLQAERGEEVEPGAGEQPTPSVDANAVDLDTALRELRDLGTRADTASIGKEKQAVYADVIVRCGTCHQKLGIQTR